MSDDIESKVDYCLRALDAICRHLNIPVPTEEEAQKLQEFKKREWRDLCVYSIVEDLKKFICAKNEEYRKDYEKALVECEQDRPESFKSWSEEHISKILGSYKEWDKFTKEERSWLKRRLEVEVLKRLRYVGQLPPCSRAPIIVDQDFQYLYRELRVDPNLIKRVAKGDDNAEPEQEDLAGMPS